MTFSGGIDVVEAFIRSVTGAVFGETHIQSSVIAWATPSRANSK